MGDLIIPAYLRELNLLSIGFRFLLCIICGGIIGFERERKHRAAGFRTHILVCTGAAVTMLTGQYIFTFLTNTSDPARIGAQVISGIGFLGAGTIITTKTSRIKGLTTAAALWAAACIGIAIGIGFYEVAILATVTVLFTIVLMSPVDRVVYGKKTRKLLYAELEQLEGVKELLRIVQNNGYMVEDMEFTQSKNHKEHIAVLMKLKKKDIIDEEESLMDILNKEEDISFIEEEDIWD